MCSNWQCGQNNLSTVAAVGRLGLNNLSSKRLPSVAACRHCSGDIDGGRGSQKGERNILYEALQDIYQESASHN